MTSAVRLKHGSLSLSLSIYLAIWLCLCLSMHWSIYLCLSISFVYPYHSMSLSLSVSLFLYIYRSLSPSLSTHLSIYPSIYWQTSSTRVVILLTFSCFTLSSRCNPYFPRRAMNHGNITEPTAALKQVFSILDVTQAGGGNSLNRIGPLLAVGWCLGKNPCFDAGTHAFGRVER